MVDSAESSSTSPPPPSALLLFCGLPAAGKSTLARRLLIEGPRLLHEQLEARGVRAVRVWHICFDAVLEALQIERGATDFDPILWRESRDLVLAAVRGFVACNGAGEPPLRLPLSLIHI